MRVWMLGVMFLCLIESAQGEPIVIELTQTACQFVGAEGKDHGFKSKQAEDCVKINEQTEQDRLVQAKVLSLKAGDYIFRVHNRDVPYVLGFWLRGQGLGRLTLPSVSGGGIKTADHKDYAVSLKAGEYYYSCPLNPTPNYTLVVQ